MSVDCYNNSVLRLLPMMIMSVSQYIHDCMYVVNLVLILSVLQQGRWEQRVGATTGHCQWRIQHQI